MWGAENVRTVPGIMSFKLERGFPKYNFRINNKYYERILGENLIEVK